MYTFALGPLNFSQYYISEKYPLSSTHLYEFCFGNISGIIDLDKGNSGKLEFL